VPVLRILLAPSDEWAPRAVTLAPFEAILFVALYTSAIGTWIGNRRARISFLACLTGLAAMNLVEACLGFIFWLSRHDQFGPSGTHTDWFGLTYGLWWILWLAFNYWYLLGPRTRIIFRA
jgi:hypothetical protein